MLPLAAHAGRRSVQQPAAMPIHASLLRKLPRSRGPIAPTNRQQTGKRPDRRLGDQASDLHFLVAGGMNLRPLGYETHDARPPCPGRARASHRPRHGTSDRLRLSAKSPLLRSVSLADPLAQRRSDLGSPGPPPSCSQLPSQDPPRARRTAPPTLKIGGIATRHGHGGWLCHRSSKLAVQSSSLSEDLGMAAASRTGEDQETPNQTAAVLTDLLTRRSVTGET